MTAPAEPPAAAVTVPDVTRRNAALLSAAIAVLAATSAGGQNLFPNPDFDIDIAGWMAATCNESLAPSWSPDDASGNPASGSLRLRNTSPTDNFGYNTCFHCFNVTGPATYRLSGKARVPGGQLRELIPAIILFRHPEADCQGEFNGHFDVGASPIPKGSWRNLGTETITVPAAGGSFFVGAGFRKVGDGGEAVGFLDELRLCRNNNCATSADGWLTSSEFPDFRFRVQFSGAAGLFYGAKESDCLPDTLCVSSELVGRTAVLLRIIGPRPNGYLWFQATRFPAQQVDIEVQQLSTGIVKTYRLERLDPDDTEIPGRLDRTAFLP